MGYKPSENLVDLVYDAVLEQNKLRFIAKIFPLSTKHKERVREGVSTLLSCSVDRLIGALGISSYGKGLEKFELSDENGFCSFMKQELALTIPMKRGERKFFLNELYKDVSSHYKANPTSNQWGLVQVEDGKIILRPKKKTL